MFGLEGNRFHVSGQHRFDELFDVPFGLAIKLESDKTLKIASPLSCSNRILTSSVNKTYKLTEIILGYK